MKLKLNDIVGKLGSAQLRKKADLKKLGQCPKLSAKCFLKFKRSVSRLSSKFFLKEKEKQYSAKWYVHNFVIFRNYVY